MPTAHIPTLGQPLACLAGAYLALKSERVLVGRVRLGGSPADPTDLARTLTQLLQHLVTLVQHKVFHISQVEAPIPHECQNPAWSPHHNVRTILLQHFFILLDGEAPKEHRHLCSGKEVIFVHLRAKSSYPTQYHWLPDLRPCPLRHQQSPMPQGSRGLRAWA